MEKKLKYEVRDFDVDSNYLVVALTGDLRGKKFDKNKPEWRNALRYKYKHLSFKKWYIPDVKVAWWHTDFPGLPGYGPHILATYIKKTIKELNIDNVCMMGLSQGGYGAILLGCLIEADVVVAYSPQTWLSKDRYRKNHLHERFKGFVIPETQKDLKLFLENNNNSKTIYHIYYGEKNKKDKHHAERMKDIRGMILHPVDSNHHTVAKILVKDGTVENILENITKGNYNF